MAFGSHVKKRNKNIPGGHSKQQGTSITVCKYIYRQAKQPYTAEKTTLLHPLESGTMEPND